MRREPRECGKGAKRVRKTNERRWSQRSTTHLRLEEVQVDVSGDRQRAIFDRSRPFYMPGFRVTHYVPFRGDTDLLKCQPNTFAIAAIRRLRRLFGTQTC